MNKIEYFKYLSSIPELDFLENEVGIEESEIADHLFGAFQCFMPSGENLEKVFEPIRNGDELYRRIRPIFERTKERFEKCAEEGTVPGYFVVNAKENIDSELICIGNEFIANLHSLAGFFKENNYPDYDGFINKIKNIRDVKLVENRDELEKYRDSTTEYIRDMVSDWITDNEDNDSLLDILREAYYSINCSYWLSYYLQYPSYKNKPEIDFFEPDFMLWQRGYMHIFYKDGLIISPS